MITIDTPERFRAIYGFSKEDLQTKQADISKWTQSTKKGKKLWREMEGRTAREFMPCKIGGIYLWNPIMRCSARKTVVETPLVERNGSVKEIISVDDWVITIRGTIKRPDGYWPADKLEQLNELWLRNEAIEIISPRTSILLNGNEYVVLTNVELPEKQGFTESMDYSIECVSDRPFVLELDEDGKELKN